MDHSIKYDHNQAALLHRRRSNHLSYSNL